jgi:hypothetical protein
MIDLHASITVLVVYRVPVDEKELLEQLRRYYFFGNAVRDTNSVVHKFVENCIPLVLFEVHLHNLDERFQIADFTQEMPESPQNAWQSAYDEALLSQDGMSVLARQSTCTRGLSFRPDRVLLPLLRSIEADVMDLWAVF